MSDQKRKVTGELNTLLRYKASVDLFHVLADLGVEAALAHEGALSLHQNAPKGLREIKVVVKYEAELAMGAEDICNKVVAHPNGYRFSNKAKNGLLGLEYDPMDPSMDPKKCRVEFALSGDPFPIILENFNEILCIQGIPVMPVHAILLQQVLLMSESDPAKRREVSVALVQDCLDAIGDVVLDQLSPQWNSRRVLDAIKLLVLQKPGRNPSQWITLGVNPHIFRAAGPVTVAISPSSSKTTARAPKTFVEDESPSPTADISLLPAQNTTPTADHGPSPEVMEPTPEVPENNRVVVNLVAKVVVSALNALGFDSAIFGSTACQMYGNTRTPGDLDILVLPPEPFHQDQEWIKQQIVNRYPAHFTLRLGKTPGATYRVLFYKFGYGIPIPSMFAGARECKIDILLPGIMDLPRLTSSDIVWRESLPVVPFLTLLVQKLQGWGDHLESSESHKFKKHPIDAQDIVELLSLLESLPMTALRPWREKSLMSDRFQVTSFVRVKRFCRIFSATKPSWRMLGFDVE